MASRTRAGARRSTLRQSRSADQSGLYEDVLSVVRTVARGQKDYGAEKIGNIAEAVIEMSDSMAADMPNLSTYMSSAAERMQDVSDYVAESSIEDMVSDAAHFTRRHPMMAMGIAIAAGWGLMTLMQAGPLSSSTSRSTSTSRLTSTGRSSGLRGRSSRLAARRQRTMTNGHGQAANG